MIAGPSGVEKVNFTNKRPASPPALIPQHYSEENFN